MNQTIRLGHDGFNIRYCPECKIVYAYKMECGCDEM